MFKAKNTEIKDSLRAINYDRNGTANVNWQHKVINSGSSDNNLSNGDVVESVRHEFELAGNSRQQRR